LNSTAEDSYSALALNGVGEQLGGGFGVVEEQAIGFDVAVALAKEDIRTLLAIVEKFMIHCNGG